MRSCFLPRMGLVGRGIRPGSALLAVALALAPRVAEAACGEDGAVWNFAAAGLAGVPLGAAVAITAGRIVDSQARTRDIDSGDLFKSSFFLGGVAGSAVTAGVLSLASCPVEETGFQFLVHGIAGATLALGVALTHYYLTDEVKLRPVFVPLEGGGALALVGRF